jgi:hypothetical protein
MAHFWGDFRILEAKKAEIGQKALFSEMEPNSPIYRESHENIRDCLETESQFP